MLARFLEKRFGGHFSLGPLTVYGFNAMHVALNLKTRRYGYVCFHPTVRAFGVWWPWYFYLSPNATPWAATFAVGPGVEAGDRASAILRRSRFGHGFSVNEYRDELYRLNQSL